MQSNDYVPGVSGWKMYKNGGFELNAPKISIGGLPEQPQLVVVTAGSWSESELPANAIERYSFIGAELLKIPYEFREGAELSIRDESYDAGFPDICTTLTYMRRETAEEVAARQKKAAVAGSRIITKNGVTTITVDGVVRIRLWNLDKSEAPPPFVVVDNQVFLGSTFIQDGTISAKISDSWTVKKQVTADGKYVAAGLGLGSQFLTSTDRFAIKDEPAKTDLSSASSHVDAQATALSALTARVTSIGASLAVARDGSDMPDKVREIIRKELQPGGILHRK